MLSKLVGTRQTLIDFAKENNISIEDVNLKTGYSTGIEQCTHCDIWWYRKDLIEDLDGNLIDKNCEKFYGL